MTPKVTPSPSVRHNLYQVAFTELYNAAQKDVRLMMDRAKVESDYNPREVKEFVKRVIELAQSREEKKPEPKSKAA